MSETTLLCPTSIGVVFDAYHKSIAHLLGFDTWAENENLIYARGIATATVPTELGWYIWWKRGPVTNKPKLCYVRERPDPDKAYWLEAVGENQWPIGVKTARGDRYWFKIDLDGLNEMISKRHVHLPYMVVPYVHKPKTLERDRQK